MPNSERIEISICDTDAFLAVVERVKHLESINDRVAQLEEERNKLQRQLFEAHKQVDAERERADKWHAKWMALDQFMSAITDSMTDSTYQLATRFGTDFTWDELLSAAVEEIDNRAEDA